VEGVLRVGEGLALLSPALQASALQLIQQGVTAEAGLLILKKGALTLEITGRLRSEPILQRMDGKRLKTSFERYLLLDQRKKGLVREVILHGWTGRQKSRLLATTGTRLNGQGADLRRRLTLRARTPCGSGKSSISVRVLRMVILYSICGRSGWPVPKPWRRFSHAAACSTW